MITQNDNTNTYQQKRDLWELRNIRQLKLCYSILRITYIRINTYQQKRDLWELRNIRQLKLCYSILRRIDFDATSLSIEIQSVDILSNKNIDENI